MDECRRPSGNYRSSCPAGGRHVFCPNRCRQLGRDGPRAQFGRSGRRRRLLLCHISPAKVALTPFGNVYIDNCRLKHSSFEPEACVVRAGAVPYKAVQILRGRASWPLGPQRRRSMPWKNQGGGPWGSGPKGPWGSGPQPVGPRPPDLEDLLRRAQDRLQQLLPGGYFSGMGIALLLIAALAIWGLSGFFRVQSEELGVVLRFGKHVRTVQPGLNYHLPYPIETVLLPKALRVSTISIGMTLIDDPARRGRTMRDVPEESLMLTGDENIVDVDFTVLWRIKPDGVGDYLFNIQNPEGTVKAVAESAMREVVGKSNIQPILTGARTTTEQGVQELMQKTLDSYGSGILVQQVQMQKVDPPAQVIDAFRDVQAARADLERLQNEAQTYANRVVPDAKGRAAQIIQVAEGYKQQAVAEAKGQSARFLKVYDEYKKPPDVTRERIYLETMERILGGSEKLIYDGGGASSQGVVPYLPLNELTPRPQPPATTGQPQQPSGATR